MKKVETPKKIPEIGIHFGKHDLDRFGYFAEMSYLHGQGYIKPITTTDIRDLKNRQMLPEYPKIKVTGLQDVYFEKVFKRLFVGEAYLDTLRHCLRQRNEEAKKMRGLFRPPSFTHLQSTPGDYFGCFTKWMRAFDPRNRPLPEVTKNPTANVIKFIPSNPAKKGGYGYLNYTINPFPKYMPSPYEVKFQTQKDSKGKGVHWLLPSPPGLFQKSYVPLRISYNKKVQADWSLFGVFKPTNPAKSLGGCMAGCFDIWPRHSYEKYHDPWKIKEGKVTAKGLTKKVQKPGERNPIWIPCGESKSYQCPSVMNRKVHLSTNERTWKEMKPITFTREFL